jgi:hypothetical protein
VDFPSTRATLNARRSTTAFVAVICATMIAACGSADRPTGAGPTGGPLLSYARCIRAHGVPDFPDPSATGGLIIPNDINPGSPAFKSAQQACGEPAQGHDGRQESSQSRKLELLALARCMRSHGVPNFRDPTDSPPAPSGGNAIGGNGWYLSLGTQQERQSPAYKRAAAACGGGGL